MPVKKISNHLMIDEVESNSTLSFVTRSKKNHFTCTASKLSELLVDATYTSTGYFNTYVATHPFVAVLVIGEPDKLAEYKDMLKNKITNVLQDYHSKGNVTI